MLGLFGHQTMSFIDRPMGSRVRDSFRVADHPGVGRFNGGLGFRFDTSEIARLTGMIFEKQRSASTRYGSSYAPNPIV